MQTEPPPTSTFSQTVNQWIIYDSYVDYEYQKEIQDEQELKKRTYGEKVAKKRLLVEEDTNQNRELSDKVVKAARVLERMVNQNIYIDIALGIIFRYHQI
jgi:dynein intermediate chain 1